VIGSRTVRLAIVLVLAGILAIDLGTPAAELPRSGRPLHHAERGFRNPNPGYAYSALGRAGRLLRRTLDHGLARGPVPAVVANDGGALRANGGHPTVTWIGHSTLLVQLDGLNLLTDPHWSERASPVGFAGPRRLVPPGVRLEDLPPIHAVLISHDHYDHLDAATVRRIAREHDAVFFVPLGLKAWLADVGVGNVVEMDWWQSRAWRGLVVTCTPAQHSSGRGLRDQNLRLWSSWAVAGRERRFFFAGDTGYDVALREIGRRLGPFDLALIPIGGYAAWPHGHPNHVNPEEALTLFEDVDGRLLVPMHWGTFSMHREPFREPPERLLREARRRGLEDRIGLLSPGQTIAW
jgi:N-acyl-phosphatidylethanolamine-hydrolysing phospholipase D